MVRTSRRVASKRVVVEHSGLLHMHSPELAVAGLDEAGRGCLAGPVVAAAVMLVDGFDLVGLGDSKTIRPAERERLAKEIKALAPAWGIGIVWMASIERLNILQASLLAMTRSVQAMRCRFSVTPGRLFIDGNKTIPHMLLERAGLKGIAQEAIVDGDASNPCISAASILAKTFRDDLMVRLARRWPEYQFEAHKGYGTALHYEKLRQFGPCHLHRLDFKGVLPPQKKQEQCSLF